MARPPLGPGDSAPAEALARSRRLPEIAVALLFAACSGEGEGCVPLGGPCVQNADCEDGVCVALVPPVTICQPGCAPLGVDAGSSCPRGRSCCAPFGQWFCGGPAECAGHLPCGDTLGNERSLPDECPEDHRCERGVHPPLCVLACAETNDCPEPPPWRPELTGECLAEPGGEAHCEPAGTEPWGCLGQSECVAEGKFCSAQGGCVAPPDATCEGLQRREEGGPVLIAVERLDRDRKRPWLCDADPEGCGPGALRCSLSIFLRTPTGAAVPEVLVALPGEPETLQPRRSGPELPSPLAVSLCIAAPTPATFRLVGDGGASSNALCVQLQ